MCIGIGDSPFLVSETKGLRLILQKILHVRRPLRLRDGRRTRLIAAGNSPKRLMKTAHAGVHVVADCSHLEHNCEQRVVIRCGRRHRGNPDVMSRTVKECDHED